MSGSRATEFPNFLNPRVAIGDLEHDRRSGGATPPDPAQDVHGVALELHTGAAAITALPAAQLAVDQAHVYAQPGGQSLHQSGQRAPMGFAGGTIRELTHRFRGRIVYGHRCRRNPAKPRGGPQPKTNVVPDALG